MGQIFSPKEHNVQHPTLRELLILQAEEMAEPEIATKAPENDAAEQSLFPNDTRAQDGASMGVWRS